MIFDPLTNLWNLKEVCIYTWATHIIKDGVRYSVPEGWISSYVTEERPKLWSDRFKPHVPFLKAIND